MTTERGHIPLSANLDWNTPDWIRNGAEDVFGGVIDLDPSSNQTSIVKATVEYKLPTNDGLTDRWDINGPGTTVFLNPVFGRAYMKPDRSSVLGAKDYRALPEDQKGLYSVHTSITHWVKKAIIEASQNAVESILLIPGATDTSTWQQHLWKSATAICFIQGRIRFLMPDGQAGGPCPMAMALAYLGPNPGLFREVFESRGYVIALPDRPTSTNGGQRQPLLPG